MRSNQSRRYLSFVDVKRAHFYGKATRTVFVELPTEAGHGKSKVGRLLRSMYGCRDAGMNWEIEVARVMKKLGFEQGVSSPCIYYHPERDMRSLIHGDDLTSLGGLDDLEWLHRSLAHEWSIVVRALLGPPGSPGCSQSTTILNRIVSWETWGISWEADPRHAE